MTPMKLAAIAKKIKLGEHSEWQAILELHAYKKGKGWKADGFRSWEKAVQSLVKRCRKSRSNVLAKLSTVGLLISGSVTPAQLEQMGSTNAAHLRRIYRVMGMISKTWLHRALTWDTERMREATAKACKPKQEPFKDWKFRLPISLYVRGEQQVGRLQALLADKPAPGEAPKEVSRVTVGEFLIVMCENATDEAIKHEAGSDDAGRKVKK